VPVIQGANSHEGRVFVSPTLTVEGYLASLAGFAASFGRTASEAYATYPLSAYPSPFEAASAALGDFAFACSARRSNQLLSQWVPKYAYEFDDANASALGAAHGAEVKYLFNVTQSGAAGDPGSLPPTRQQLALAMQLYWTNFARTGDPNAANVPYWKRYFGFYDTIHLLLPPTPGVDLTFSYSARHKCAFWFGS